MSFEKGSWYTADPHRDTLRIRSTLRPEADSAPTNVKPPEVDIDSLHELLEGGMAYPEARRQVQAAVAELDVQGLHELDKQLLERADEVVEGTGHLSDLEVIVRRELADRRLDQ